VLDDGLLVGAVGVGGQQHHGVRAGRGGVLGPPACLVCTVRRDAGHDREPVRGGVDRRADHGRALVVGQHLVLTERAVRGHAVAARLGEPAHVLRIAIQIEGQLAVEGDGGRHEDSVPGLSVYSSGV
jgi:hypothetical protein